METNISANDEIPKIERFSCKILWKFVYWTYKGTLREKIRHREPYGIKHGHRQKNLHFYHYYHI